MEISHALNNYNLDTNNVNNINLNNVINVNETIKQKQRKAIWLVDKFNEPDSINFFLKVCWNIPEKVDLFVSDAFEKGHNPMAYFIWQCKREMDKR